jgi:Acetyltransferase (GNAT) domain
MLAECPRVRLTLKSAASTPRTPKASAKYVARLARSADEVRRAQQLRFEVFNLELGEGLAESYATGLDVDPFDEFCDHLIVEELVTSEIVGTYRLQTGQLASANLGYYSEREFDFAPYEPIRCEMIYPQDSGRNGSTGVVISLALGNWSASCESARVSCTWTLSLAANSAAGPVAMFQLSVVRLKSALSPSAVSPPG